MRIHREGRAIIWTTFAIAALIIFICCWCLHYVITCIAGFCLLLLLAFVIRFFRSPRRTAIENGDMVFSPCDGEVVVIEEVEEPEFFKDRRLQVSIFMSIWNVHINWFPTGGKVIYFRHHHGKFMVAWHPKSSEENERTTTVVDTGHCKVLFRQIAGILARRIVSYAKEGYDVRQNAECGFIKFGSRVDMFLPIGTEVKVKLGDKVTGTQTVIAEFKK